MTPLLPDSDASVDEQREISAYLSAVSHELRTPLTGIRGYAEMLLSGTLGEVNERQRSGLGKISHLSHRLESMVEDLIIVLQKTSGTFQPYAELVVVNDLVERMRLSLAGLCASTGVTLQVEVAGSAGQIGLRADPRLLERALVNVASNAVKFSPQGGAAQVAVSSGRSEVTFVITDRGIGIPEQDLALLFTPMFTASAAREHGLAGPGLGLVVADAIVRGHRGMIWLSSKAAEGTTVTITLPISDEEPKVAADA